MNDIYELKEDSNNDNNKSSNNIIESEIDLIKREFMDVLFKKYPQKESLSNIKNLFEKIVDKESFRFQIDKIFFNKLIDWDTYFKFLWKIWEAQLWKYLLFKEKITSEQLTKALEIQKEWVNKLLWNILIELWFITEEVLFDNLANLWIIRVWEDLLRLNLITRKQLEEALLLQKENNKPILKILNELWCISEEVLNNFLFDLEAFDDVDNWEFLNNRLNKSNDELYSWDWERPWYYLL